MITYFFETIEPFVIDQKITSWLQELIEFEEKKEGAISFIFCDDEYLLQINKDYLQHDYFTDIITFDYVKAKTISGDIFISLQRIKDNASTLNTAEDEEFRRVLAHGLLHLCGYKDKTEAENAEMRSKEDFYLQRF